jgi:hypothetical protein
LFQLHKTFPEKYLGQVEAVKLHGSKDTDPFKEQEEINEVRLVAFFLLGAFVGYVLAHLL